MPDFNISSLGNLSNAYKSNVAFVINGNDSIYWCKNYKIPSKTMTPLTEERAPYSIKIPNNDFDYGDFDLDFFIDEEFNTFFEFDEWLERFRLETYTDDDIVYANLFLFNNQNTEIVARVEFKDLFVSGFNGFEFDNIKNNDQLVANFNFVYDKWSLKR